MFINNQGRIYFGQMAQGDRLATQVEIDAYNFNQAKATQLNLINKGFNNQVGLITFTTSGLTSNPAKPVTTTFQADSESRGRLTATIGGFTATTLPANFFWVDSLNNQVPMTYADLQNLLTAGATQFFTAFQRLQTLKGQINSATTASAVNLVIW